jgi:thiamine kinase-like enzyme
MSVVDREEGRLAELRGVLRDAYEDVDAVGEIVDHQRLKSRIFRVRILVSGEVRSLILKRLDPRFAELNCLLTRRWLPAFGLTGCAPQLLAVAGDRRGRWVWHVYEDLGDAKLQGSDPDPKRVEAAVELIARLHTSAAGHPLLGECRHHGGDLGMYYFSSNVLDAIRGLEALRSPRVELSPDDRATRDGLLARLYGLLEERPRRAQAMEEHAGPDTLLHGDLWTSNTFVAPAGDGLRAWLIDWDHAAIGPLSYDLSTFLYRFPMEDRPWILDCYRRAVARTGWRLPPPPELNLLFETAECARYASRVIWPAIALLQDGAGWASTELAEVLGWFEELEPVLPS